MVRVTASTLFGLTAGLIGFAVAQDFPACDTAETMTQTSRGNAMVFTTDDPTFYLATGLGSCGINYTDTDAVACVAPGWTGSAQQSRCNSWVTLTLPQTGRTTAARVLDTCGTSTNPSFGCNDLFVSLSVFRTLAGETKEAQDAAVNAGRLPFPVVWSFTDQPCYACAMGLPGRTPDGKSDDTCQGFDASGYLRCGRKTGSDVVALADVDKVCNHDVCDCNGGAGGQSNGGNGDHGGMGGENTSGEGHGEGSGIGSGTGHSGQGEGSCDSGCDDSHHGGGGGINIGVHVALGQAKLLKKRKV